MLIILPERPSKFMSGSSSLIIGLNIIVDLLALFLALMIFIDSVIRKTKNTDKKSRKTDWYFKEEKYDKEVDDRIDKNHYKFL